MEESIIDSAIKERRVKLQTGLRLKEEISTKRSNSINATCVNYVTTRNTFCGTWYLPHSRVYKSIAELCMNFGDSAINTGQIAYFSLCMRETPIILLPVKI